MKQRQKVLTIDNLEVSLIDELKKQLIGSVGKRISRSDMVLSLLQALLKVTENIGEKKLAKRINDFLKQDQNANSEKEFSAIGNSDKMQRIKQKTSLYKRVNMK